MHHIAAPFGQRLRQRHCGIKRRAALIQAHHFNPSADQDLPRIRRQRTDQHIQQRRLTRAIGAQNTHAITAHDARRKPLHDRALTKGFADIIGDDHQIAGPASLGRCHAHTPGRAAALSAPGAQSLQVFQAPYIALAPRGYAIAQPMFFAHDLTRKLMRIAFFFFQHLVAPALKRAKALFQAARCAAIQPDHGAGKPFQKAPIMADQDQRRCTRGQFRFQPFNHRQVEVIGRFVQQQNVRFWRQGAG